MLSDPFDSALAALRAIRARGGVAVLGNDIDLTLSTGGGRGESDPRRTAIREDTGAALRALEARGHIVGIITNRSGRQAARMLAERGVRTAEIVGTYGMEVFHADASDPALGTATIDARFAPYARTITGLLRAVRETLYDTVGLTDDPGRAVEVEIPTAAGPILLERKGVCAAFPEGLAHVYNFNLAADRRERGAYLARMTERYRAAMRAAPDGAALGRVWGLAPSATEPDDDRFSWALEPLVAQGKAYGMIALLRAARRRLDDPARIGLVAFAGDSDADAQAMRAAHLVAAVARHVAGREPPRALGVWVRPEGADAPRAAAQADITVEGPPGYARLLGEMARVSGGQET